MQTDSIHRSPTIKVAGRRFQPGRLAALTLAGALSACAGGGSQGLDTDGAARQVPRTPRQVVGFVGDGAAAVTDKFNATMLVTIGNHAARGIIQNLVPETDPDYSRGRWVVRRIAKLDGRLDGLGYSITQQEADIGAWLYRKAAAVMQPTAGLSGQSQFTWWAPNIEAAFFFKGMGIDPAIASLLGGSPPLSRVIADPDYVLPSPADSTNPFPCAALNSLGHWFHAYLNGAGCTDGDAGPPRAQ